MTVPDTDLAADLRDYLLLHEWVEVSTGGIGTLWQSSSADRERCEIGVPHSISRDSYELRGVAERLSRFEQRSPDEVEKSILHFGVDITYLRAANDVVIADTIPLSAGATMIEAARLMLRATATTAQRPRADIAGNYSKAGDDFVDEIRMGHTEQGSYIVPVLVRVGRRHDAESPQEPLTGFDHRVDAFESPTRRITRTFAETMKAVVDKVITPARDPRPSVVPDLVAAGASREFVSALGRILADPAVAEFETRFDWAQSQRAPEAVPKSLTAPAAAVPLLEKTAKMMKAAPRPKFEILTGPIVQVRHEPGSPVGYVSVSTVRNGRTCEVRVWLQGGLPSEVHAWMMQSTTILVQGKVERAGSAGLNIRYPEAFGPLSDTYISQPSKEV
ncbi:hypothetical protein NVV99_24345 [Rhodococcus sp. PAE-6]|uniref:hypothetical protein n=1 Tax=Rhodococcus sp. PAE-6 TaxID=2972477 RepID=UPI0021B44462|nr:hypothetical protein [Rhodococcus sp. PAE-6]MCT7294032.1 hypothetical protein [Rhodococcus sp. PAE-6]